MSHILSTGANKYEHVLGNPRNSMVIHLLAWYKIFSFLFISGNAFYISCCVPRRHFLRLSHLACV